MEIQKRLSVLACRWSRSPHNSICKWGLQSRPVFHPWRKWCQTITSQDYKWGCKSCMNVSLEHEAGVCVCVCVSLCAQSCSTLCNHHGLQPARLLGPWDFPGENTEVDCHFLLIYVFMCMYTHTYTCIHQWIKLPG